MTYFCQRTPALPSNISWASLQPSHSPAAAPCSAGELMGPGPCTHLPCCAHLCQQHALSSAIAWAEHHMGERKRVSETRSSSLESNLARSQLFLLSFLFPPRKIFSLCQEKLKGKDISRIAFSLPLSPRFPLLAHNVRSNS